MAVLIDSAVIVSILAGETGFGGLEKILEENRAGGLYVTPLIRRDAVDALVRKAPDGNKADVVAEAAELVDGFVNATKAREIPIDRAIAVLAVNLSAKDDLSKDEAFTLATARLHRLSVLTLEGLAG